jgi:hypothetical protein
MKRTIGTSRPAASSSRGWIGRLGWAGFIFFLVKGLVWLAVLLGAGTLWTS